ncbi:MAG: hypothetical protein ACETWM_14470 [Candidatus Lokiarchaeia archaeon]
MNKQSLRKIIEEVIKDYNKYRSPEVTARVVSTDVKSLKIEFTGSYCHTCGFYDYFDDFRYKLQDMGVKSSIEEVEETEDGAVVTFLMID